MVVIINETVLAARPADVSFVVGSHKVVPIIDFNVLDSWTDNLPMIKGDWFLFVVLWVDNTPGTSSG